MLGKIYTRISQVFLPHEILPWSFSIFQFSPPLTHQSGVEFIQVLHTKAPFALGLTDPSPF
jgi:hypothetical protein